MVLDEYKSKRKFGKTSEPKAETTTKSHSRFVIQEHHASTLHYDFRLELPDKIKSKNIVLKSWAVPKNLPKDKGTKRLAVATENHPVSYIDFEGEIPKGEYGAGKVIIWDTGKFELLKRDSGHIQFILQGKKIKDEYHMIKTKSFGAKQESWLIFRT